MEVGITLWFLATLWSAAVSLNMLTTRNNHEFLRSWEEGSLPLRLSHRQFGFSLGALLTVVMEVALIVSIPLFLRGYATALVGVLLLSSVWHLDAARLDYFTRHGGAKSLLPVLAFPIALAAAIAVLASAWPLLVAVLLLFFLWLFRYTCLGCVETEEKVGELTPHEWEQLLSRHTMPSSMLDRIGLESPTVYREAGELRVADSPKKEGELEYVIKKDDEGEIGVYKQTLIALDEKGPWEGKASCTRCGRIREIDRAHPPGAEWEENGDEDEQKDGSRGNLSENEPFDSPAGETKGLSHIKDARGTYLSPEKRTKTKRLAKWQEEVNVDTQRENLAEDYRSYISPLIQRFPSLRGSDGRAQQFRILAKNKKITRGLRAAESAAIAALRLAAREAGRKPPTRKKMVESFGLEGEEFKETKTQAKNIERELKEEIDAEIPDGFEICDARVNFQTLGIPELYPVVDDLKEEVIPYHGGAKENQFGGLIYEAAKRSTLADVPREEIAEEVDVSGPTITRNAKKLREKAGDQIDAKLKEHGLLEDDASRSG